LVEIYAPKNIAKTPEAIWIKPAKIIFSLTTKEAEAPATKETVVTNPASKAYTISRIILPLGVCQASPCQDLSRPAIEP